MLLRDLTVLEMLALILRVIILSIRDHCLQLQILVQVNLYELQDDFIQSVLAWNFDWPGFAEESGPEEIELTRIRLYVLVWSLVTLDCEVIQSFQIAYEQRISHLWQHIHMEFALDFNQNQDYLLV